MHTEPVASKISSGELTLCSVLVVFAIDQHSLSTPYHLHTSIFFIGEYL